MYNINSNKVGSILSKCNLSHPSDRDVQERYTRFKAWFPFTTDVQVLQRYISECNNHIAHAQNSLASAKTTPTRLRLESDATAFKVIKAEIETYLQVLQQGGTPTQVNQTGLPCTGAGNINFQNIIDKVIAVAIPAIIPGGGNSGNNGNPYGGGQDPYDPLPPTKSNMGSTILMVGLVGAGLMLLTGGGKAMSK